MRRSGRASCVPTQRMKSHSHTDTPTLSEMRYVRFFFFFFFFFRRSEAWELVSEIPSQSTRRSPPPFLPPFGLGSWGFLKNKAFQDPNKPQAPTLPRLSQTGKSGACGLLGAQNMNHICYVFWGCILGSRIFNIWGALKHARCDRKQSIRSNTHAHFCP